jgi:hypothetical protein
LIETEIAPWRPRSDQAGVEIEFGVIAWGGTDNVTSGMIIGTMIRHTLRGRGRGGSGQALGVSALAVAVIEAAFLRLLLPEVGGT